MTPVAPELRSTSEVRVLCLMIVLQANVSFRSVPRILALFFLSGEWVPHFTSAINWTLRLGLGLLNAVGPVDGPWVAIVDHSIDVGTKKVLAVLRVRWQALAERGSGLTLADCECVGLQVSEKTDGETVAAGLAAIFGRCGSPVAVIRDGGSDLKRGLELWKERSESKTEIIYDVGHAIANGLKADYQNRKPFAAFLALVRRAGSRLRQTRFAFLAPPKLRTKGRFQGILRLADWAEAILGALDEAKLDPECAPMREAFSGLSKLKAFVLEFAASCIAGSEIMKILKNEGLCQKTYESCKSRLEWLGPRSKRRLEKWFAEHLAIQERLGLGAMPVSSDVIESLFGRFKGALERGSAMDMNRSVLLLPALCGELGKERAARILKDTPHRSLEAWEQTNIPYTQGRKRRDFLRSGTIGGGRKAGNAAPAAG